MTQPTLDDRTYRQFLDWVMMHDMVPNMPSLVLQFLNQEARKRGYQSWVDAYHEIP